MTLTSSQLKQFLPAVAVRSAGDFLLHGMSIDSRKIKSGDLFVALQGTQVDGHHYVVGAAEKGASAALVEHWIEDADIPQIRCDDAVIGMGQIASLWRDLCPPQHTITVTGSNGKTTVKQMLAAIFAAQYPEETLLVTEGNLNNHLGVPLMLARLSEQTQVAILEHGANHPGEIKYLCSLSKPTIALITNAGPAHLEGFKSIEGVAYAKGEMIQSLPEDGVAIINADDQHTNVWQTMADHRKRLLFGVSEHADVRLVDYSQEGLTLAYHDQTVRIETNLHGQHNAMNLAGAVAVAIAAGVDFEQAARSGATFSQEKGRLQLVEQIKAADVYDDSYNANPASVIAGMQSLSSEQPKWLVLGAMGELGADAKQWHHQIGEQAAALGFERVFGLGDLTQATTLAFGSGEVFEQHEALAEALHDALVNPEAKSDQKPQILVKGSRSAHMERVVQLLVEARC